MQKRITIPILLTALLGVAEGCNSDDTSYDYTYSQSTSVQVTSFSLTNDSNVLDSLENVFFTIDLTGGKIFNADSLPYGTDVSRLIPNIGTPTTASEVSLRYYCPEIGTDSIVDYITNSTDSINFANGPVALTVKSEGGLATKIYEIKVNVHQVQSDSLAWYSMEKAPLPTTFTTVDRQRTVLLDGTYYCLSSYGDSYSVATTTDIDAGEWQSRDVTFGFAPDVESLRSSDTSLYILSDNGELYTSDDFSTWSATGETWHYIYGGYTSDVIGSKTDGSAPLIASYPGGKQWTMPENFPIDGTSQPVSYELPMGYGTQIVMAGGRHADGTLESGAWGFDGDNWAYLTDTPLPEGLSQLSMVPYYYIDTPISTWVPVAYPALLAFGGKNSEGDIDRTMYMSVDFGMTWEEAPELLQFPEDMNVGYGASAFEQANTLGSRSSSQWTRIATKTPPRSAHWVSPLQSRATEPVTTWQCPCIYTFGGTDSDGQVIDQVWKGVILHFTFKPVQ